MALLTSLNQKITKQLSSGGIVTRCPTDHGLRLCLYLPLCYPESRALLLFPSLSFILLPPPNAPRSTLRSLSECIIHTALVYFTFGFNTKYGFLPGAVTTALFSLLYPYCLVTALRLCPKSFTLGEGSIVVGGLMLFVMNTVFNIHRSVYYPPVSQHDIITLILQMGILSVLLVVRTLYKFSPGVNLATFVCVVAGYIILLLASLHVLLGQSAVLWVISFLLKDPTRLKLIAFWSVTSLLGVAAVFGQIFSGAKATTSQRKVFHVLCTAVYISGYIWDPYLIYLASGVALAALIALETMRKLQLGGFSVILNEGFVLFADEKDAGISLTPLYLLIGLSVPLALSPLPTLPLLHCLAGVLSIGIGDTFASHIGSKYGKIHWPGTSKSVEGTLASIISQMATLGMLIYFGFIDYNTRTMLICSLAVTVNAIEEALTNQVDNLTLPLITYAILSLA